ncbi:MAG TPA: HEAT repeat domain-containing protein, partial [Gemmatimonadaceae bacterium]|nr:HEAT repeat domain-containing protein [Gemmatimonadaceae bacterium]
AAMGIAAATLPAQSIAKRVAQVKDGTVRMSYASRSDVCGNGAGNISTHNGSQRNSSSSGSTTITTTRHNEWEDECESGPVRVAIDVADGKPIALRAYVGGRWRPGTEVTDLGTVPARDAVDYLLDDLARADGRVAGEAIFPATIADSVTVWPRLLSLAKDDSRTKDVRKQAVFWVSQAAGEKATEGLKEVVGDAATDQDVRLQAVFALSQRPKDEGVPALLDVAKGSKDPRIRKQAIFWLGQSGDPRAVAYFESVLLKK